MFTWTHTPLERADTDRFQIKFCNTIKITWRTTYDHSVLKFYHFDNELPIALRDEYKNEYPAVTMSDVTDADLLALQNAVALRLTKVGDKRNIFMALPLDALRFFGPFSGDPPDKRVITAVSYKRERDFKEFILFDDESVENLNATRETIPIWRYLKKGWPSAFRIIVDGKFVEYPTACMGCPKIIPHTIDMCMPVVGSCIAVPSGRLGYSFEDLSKKDMVLPDSNKFRERSKVIPRDSFGSYIIGEMATTEDEAKEITEIAEEATRVRVDSARRNRAIRLNMCANCVLKDSYVQNVRGVSRCKAYTQSSGSNPYCHGPYLVEDMKNALPNFISKAWVKPWMAHVIDLALNATAIAKPQDVENYTHVFRNFYNLRVGLPLPGLKTESVAMVGCDANNSIRGCGSQAYVMPYADLCKILGVTPVTQESELSKKAKDMYSILVQDNAWLLRYAVNHYVGHENRHIKENERTVSFYSTYYYSIPIELNITAPNLELPFGKVELRNTDHTVAIVVSPYQIARSYTTKYPCSSDNSDVLSCDKVRLKTNILFREFISKSDGKTAYDYNNFVSLATSGKDVSTCAVIPKKKKKRVKKANVP